MTNIPANAPERIYMQLGDTEIDQEIDGEPIEWDDSVVMWRLEGINASDLIYVRSAAATSHVEFQDTSTECGWYWFRGQVAIDLIHVGTCRSLPQRISIQRRADDD